MSGEDSNKSKTKVVIHEIKRCRDCYYMVTRLIGSFCYKTHKLVEDPQKLPDDCPLPDKMVFIKSNQNFEYILPTIVGRISDAEKIRFKKLGKEFE